MFHADRRTDITKLTVPFAILRTRLKTSYAGVLSVQPNLEDKCHFFIRVFRWGHFRISDTRYTITEPAKRQKAGTFVLTLRHKQDIRNVMDDVPYDRGSYPFFMSRTL